MEVSFNRTKQRPLRYVMTVVLHSEYHVTKVTTLLFCACQNTQSEKYRKAENFKC